VPVCLSRKADPDAGESVSYNSIKLRLGTPGTDDQAGEAALSGSGIGRPAYGSFQTEAFGADRQDSNLDFGRQRHAAREWLDASRVPQAGRRSVHRQGRRSS